MNTINCIANYLIRTWEKRLFRCIYTVAGLVGLSGLPVAAQTASAPAYPSQTVRLVVPFSAGTGMDTIARTVAPRLSERLGQPVVVQNVPGASGNIGSDQVPKPTRTGTRCWWEPIRC